MTKKRYQPVISDLRFVLAIAEVPAFIVGNLCEEDVPKCEIGFPPELYFRIKLVTRRGVDGWKTLVAPLR